MTDALVRYRESVETRRLAAADKAIFQGLLSLRTHRGDAQSAMALRQAQFPRRWDTRPVERDLHSSPNLD
jgi:hypothetical protein